MANNYGFQMSQQQLQPAQYFPQPQGNIYLIQNSLEMANVPTGSGVSAAVCLSEGVMYLKMLQNGVPVFNTYNITPIENTQNNSFEDRLCKLEQEISKLQANKNKDF